VVTATAVAIWTTATHIIHPTIALVVVVKRPYIALIAMKRLMPWMGAVAEQMKSF
jgi:predicted dithiol-disulfide oxidoreductase (DUF899 family)